MFFFFKSAGFSNPKNTAGKMKDTLIEEYGEPFFNYHFPMWMHLFERINIVRNGELCSKSLDKVKAPTLVLHGKKDDLISPRHAVFLRDNIPNARYLCIFLNCAKINSFNFKWLYFNCSDLIIFLEWRSGKMVVTIFISDIRKDLMRLCSNF